MNHHPSMVPLQPEKTKKSSQLPYDDVCDIDEPVDYDAMCALFDDKQHGIERIHAAMVRKNEQKKLIELRRSNTEARLLERARAADQLQLELTKAQNQIRLLRGEVTELKTELKQTVICTICMEARCSTAFQCGHLSCSECSSRLNQCHICRRDILQRSHIFL